MRIVRPMNPSGTRRAGTTCPSRIAAGKNPLSAPAIRIRIASVQPIATTTRTRAASGRGEGVSGSAGRSSAGRSSRRFMGLLRPPGAPPSAAEPRGASLAVDLVGGALGSGAADGECVSVR